MTENQSDRAKLNRFICKQMVGGRVRCSHEDLSISVTVGTDEAKIYSREQNVEIDVDHKPEKERDWR